MLWLLATFLCVGAFWAHMKRGATPLFWGAATFSLAVFLVAIYVEDGMPSLGKNGVSGLIIAMLKSLK